MSQNCKNHNTAVDASTPSDAPAAPSQDLIADILLACDPETFAANLLTYITDDALGRHDAVLYDARVMTMLCELVDTLFVTTLLDLAAPAHAGLDVLYHEDIMQRVSALAYPVFQARLRPGLNGLVGLDPRSYLRELGHLPQRPSARGPVFAPITAEALFAEDLPDLEFIVEDILTVGATLFVGRAKDGKSLACWNLLFAVATNGEVFGRYKVTPGPVLYLALEDGKRRVQKRLKDQMRACNMTEPPKDFHIQVWESRRVGQGLEEDLNHWIDEHPGAKLIVIDILEKVRPPRTRNGSVYADDYAAVAPLQRLAQDRGIALVIVHHTNKAKADDFRNTPSGSESLLGGVDTLWSLRRIAGETAAVLQITGREVIETAELAMQFKDGFWTAMGDAATTVLNPAHQAIIDTLRIAGYPMTPSQLATKLEVNLNTMKVHLLRLVERGLVMKTGQGQYTHRIMTPESAEGETHCNPVTQAPPAQEECPAGVPDLIEEEDEDPTPQDIPMMYTPSPMDETPEENVEKPVEETPEAQVRVQVTPVTGDVPQATEPTLLSTNGHSNGHGQPATNGHSNGHTNGVAPSACRHEVKTTETYWDGSVLVKCSRCKQVLVRRESGK
jgi:hypothetical protein